LNARYWSWCRKIGVYLQTRIAVEMEKKRITILQSQQ